MFLWQRRFSIKLYNSLKRCWSDGNLVPKNDSKDEILHLASCVKSKTKKVKDNDPENIWLKNLSLENLKLYRKTSFGSFRKINLQNFFEKLKVILPKDFINEETVDKLFEKNVKGETMPIEKKQNLLASPYMCDFLIENMVTFPLLKSQYEDDLKMFIKYQKELEGVDFMRYPSVTSILQETVSPENKERLNKWKINMIQKMGLEKFQEYKQDIFNQGSKFHGALRKYLESGDERLVSIDESIEGCWSSVAKVLEDINNVVMVEESVHHPILSYKGYVDCVASYRDVPYVIEWKKTTRKVKRVSNLYDAPVQACAYLGALSWRKDLVQTVPKKCLLVIAYTNGDPADVFPLCLEQCHMYWSNFTHRLQSFWARKWPNLNSNESQL